ncbi:hypothetical protein QM012_009169 [Aureobasidium pullulans]|uniref:Uncharacterized protein n=1 Tax=Aureobasidium pullulans TaxID=5580 RepID=A0ABR0TG35_AURPU
MASTKAQARQAASQRPWQVNAIVNAIDGWKMAWPRKDGDSSALPPFPFHVYLIHSARTTAVDEILADKLVYCLSQDMLCDPCWHIEVAVPVQDNVFACIDHYEQEKILRKAGSQAPYMPDKNCLLVVDTDNWEVEGLLSVQYTREDTQLPHDVNAERFKSWNHLATCLREQWSDQGMTTIEELLDGQNLARGWPIDLNLYPENGPDEYVNGKTFAAHESAFLTSHQRFHHTLDFGGISLDVANIIDEQRQDFQDFSYTALYHRSSQAPRFVFCLFVLGRDISSEDSLKIFARLNTGLLAEVSWSLHLYSDATMSSAFSIFARDMIFRRRLDTSMYIPSSYAGPLQIYQDVYMCLDASKPQPDALPFVLSTPDPTYASFRHDVDPNDLDHIPSHVDQYAGEPDSLDLFTFNPGSWELAADMLHTYYAIASHRQSTDSSFYPIPQPRISLRVSVIPEYSCDPMKPSPTELFVTSHASEPITLNANGTIFDTMYWHHHLRIIESGSSVELARNMAANIPLRVWSLGRDLLTYGFTKRVPDTGEERPPHLVTLYPGVPLRVPVQRSLPADFAGSRPNEGDNDKRFLEDCEAEGGAHLNFSNNTWQSLFERYKGSWEVGTKYTFELQQGASIPRWTWGTEDDLKGPYGLPALDIEMKESGNRDFMLIE